MMRLLGQLKERDDERGFTLVELLIVIIIIAILAAIAIPIFLNQRERAQRSAVDSDLRNAAIEIETFFVDHQAYPEAFDLDSDPIGLCHDDAASDCDNEDFQIRESDGVNFQQDIDVEAGTFCIEAQHDNLEEDDGSLITFRFDSGEEPSVAEEDC